MRYAAAFGILTRNPSLPSGYPLDSFSWTAQGSIRRTSRYLSLCAETPATLTVPLTGLVTKEVKLIDPSSPGDPPLVKLCRNGDEFIVEFSVYDSNQNVTRATYQFMDSVNRIVGQVFDIGISEAIASRNLATGQSFTVVQRFTGASDNSQIVSVQVKVFDGDNTTDGATANKLTSGCSSSQSAPRVLLNSSPSARPRQ